MVLCFITFKRRNTFPSPTLRELLQRAGEGRILTLDLGDNIVFKQTQVYNISYRFISDCYNLLRKKLELEVSAQAQWWCGPQWQYHKGQDFLLLQMSSSRTSLSPRLHITEAFFPRTLLLGWGWGCVSLNQDGRVYPCSKMSMYYLVENAFIRGWIIIISNVLLSHSINIWKVIHLHFYFWHRPEVHLGTCSSKHDKHVRKLWLEKPSGTKWANSP